MNWEQINKRHSAGETLKELFGGELGSEIIVDGLFNGASETLAKELIFEGYPIFTCGRIKEVLVKVVRLFGYIPMDCYKSSLETCVDCNASQDLYVLMKYKLFVS